MAPELRVLNAGRFSGLGASNVPKRPTGFVAGAARNAHHRRRLKVKRHRLLERCYLLTFGLCVHSSAETKAGFKVSRDLNPAFALCDYLQITESARLEKRDTVSPFWGHLPAAVELRRGRLSLWNQGLAGRGRLAPGLRANVPLRL